MKIILSPAKQMVVEPTLSPTDFPVFLPEAKEILSWLQTLSYAQAKALWNCSDAIAEPQYRQLFSMQLEGDLSPAILSYHGIAFQYMAPSVFSTEAFAYVQQHLRILSGFYGVLRPMDGVVPYRLELQAKATVNGTKNLYEFWGDRLYRAVLDDSRIILNLASKEYSKAITPYLQPEDTFLTCVFAQMERGKPVQKGVYAKMARGEMVRYLATHGVESPEQLKDFSALDYCYEPSLSSPGELVFLKP